MEEDYLEYNINQFSFPRGIFNNQKLKLIHKFIKSLPGGSSVLDVGCGSGLISKDLINDYNIYGIDGNPNAIEYCKANYGRGNYYLIDVENSLPFEDNFFDGIIFSETIEHLVKPDTIIKELKRVLKKNGILVITTPNYDSIKWLLMERLWYPVFGGTCKPWRDDIHPSKFGEQRLHDITAKYFEPVTIGTFNFGMWLFAACYKS